MVRLHGAGNIWVEVVCHSVAHYGNGDTREMLTIQAHYPSFIHPEVMTHRMFSRNTSSSRAIPVKDQLAYLDTTFAEPIFWGKNKSGMQAGDELDEHSISKARRAWRMGKKWAVGISRILHTIGLHKQHSNRVTMPFQMVNAIISATDWENALWLRVHPDAQPEIQELFRLIYLARKASVPIHIHPEEWHTPFIRRQRETDGTLTYLATDQYGEEHAVSIDEALMISASCSAQVSYRKEDRTLEKARDLFDKLVGGVPKHASPFEHAAQVMSDEEWYERRCLIAQARRSGVVKNPEQFEYCGNLAGFISHRKFMDEENITARFSMGAAA